MTRLSQNNCQHESEQTESPTSIEAFNSFIHSFIEKKNFLPTLADVGSLPQSETVLCRKIFAALFFL